MPKLSAGYVSLFVNRNVEVLLFDLTSFLEPESISPAMVGVQL